MSLVVKGVTSVGLYDNGSIGGNTSLPILSMPVTHFTLTHIEIAGFKEEKDELIG